MILFTARRRRITLGLYHAKCYQLAVIISLFSFVSDAVITSKAQPKQALRVEDLFSLKDIVSLQMSPDGNEVVYSVRERDLRTNRVLQTVWRVSTNGKAQPVRLADSWQDSSPQWSPDGRVIAFISARSGSSQIWLLHLSSGRLERATDVNTGVLAFKWSPDSAYLAFLATASNQTPFKQALDKQHGVVIWKKEFTVYDLLRSPATSDPRKPIHLWLLQMDSREVKELVNDLHVERSDSFAWSPDGRSVAVAGKPTPSFYESSSIYLYSLDDGSKKKLLGGEGGEDWEHFITYSSPCWSPDGLNLAFLYTDYKDRWSAIERLGIYSLETRKYSLLTTEESLELYDSKLAWLRPDQLYFENTHFAGRGLYSLSVKDRSVRRVIDYDGYDSYSTFPADGNRVAFVRQSLREPPEIYLTESPFQRVRRVTTINRSFDPISLPETERVKWTSDDGTEVEGWLFKPRNYHPGKAYPLLVLVHGGPTYVVANRFEPYYTAETLWTWPYPLRLFAGRGYALFIPNYRGTGSYGKGFRRFRHIFNDASTDILSGIRYLVREGIADPKLIGLMGHSHGCRLGAYLMAHHRIFKAASFGEESVNFIAMSEQSSGLASLNIVEYYWGQNSSPYNNPQVYLDNSPIFHFKGLVTPTLLEYGEQGTAVGGLSFLSALWRQGVPHEMVIYPKTGHNIDAPMLQMDSMNRNLDWFDYWILGKKDPDAVKQEQYARWETMSKEMEQMRRRNQRAAAR